MHIDTLSIARDLRAAELSPEHAEAIAAAIGRSVNEGAASKADLESLRTSIDVKLDAVKHELRSDLEKLRSQLTLSLVGSQVAIAGIVLAILKL
ncbi:hypothetical protein [Sphingomonas lenta]|uniref:DUF1640 domain-containing protein n=1 Tax=Sphingomonas lenta TaxID=1141887 RepID=A0A2A2SHS6_9SPHN|nr:hypothetical protein [Sphingomonas lenta]PAX08796.1 hypothetical protein CKY28_05400 [Sphingomonas lenta]